MPETNPDELPTVATVIPPLTEVLVFPLLTFIMYPMKYHNLRELMKDEVSLTVGSTSKIT